jgi:hypothetical protein
VILVDFNQVCIANFMSQVGNHTNVKIEEDLVRHMVLNSIRMIRSKFSEKYGEIVICSDNRKYWRREIFPYYKANRKKDRDKSDVDWHSLFTFLNKIREELRDHFPYKVLNVEGAEADDIIGTLVKKYSDSGEHILVVSSDKDFMQLQKYANVDQYSPIMKKFVRTDDPNKYIFEHILKGDRGDGIPNFLSDDDTFVMGKRQKPLSKKRIDTVRENGIESLGPDGERGYYRNRQLVDLDYIPDNITDKILNEYYSSVPNSRSNLLNYFIKHKLKNLMETIGEF